MADKWRALTDNEKLVAMMAANIYANTAPNLSYELAVNAAELIIDEIVSDRGGHTERSN